MRRGAIQYVWVCAAAVCAMLVTAGVSLGQAAYTWEWPGGNAATGTWSERVGGAGTNLRYWKRNGAATAVLPGPNDTVVITSPTNGVGQVNFDGTGFNAGTGQIVHVFRSFEVRPLNTMRINHTQGVSSLYIRATVGDLVIGSNGAIEDAILRGDQVNGGVNNVPGCEVSLESVAQVRVAGRVYGGAPKGNANNTLRGGNVKLVSTRNGGVGVQVTGSVIAGNGADNTSSPGGNVIVQADTADLDLLRSNRAVWAGRGGNNTIGANGGAGGSVTIRSGRAITLGTNNPGDLAAGWIFGGDGGSGLGIGGAGGNVTFQGGNVRAASLEVKFTALVFAGTGGATTQAMNGNVPIAGQGGVGGALLIDVVGNVTVEGWIKAGNGGSAARDNVNDAASRSIGKGGAGGVAEVKSGGAVLLKYTGLIAGGDGGGHDYPGAGGRVDVIASGHVRNKGMVRGGNSHTIDGNRAGRLWAANHNGDGGKATVTSTNGNVILEQEAGTQTVAQVRGGNAGGASRQMNIGGYRGGGVSINAPRGDYSAERRGKSLVLPGDGGPPKGQGGKVEINAKKVVKIGHLGSGFDGDARHALAGASIAGVELVSADPLDEAFGRRIDVSVGPGGVFSAANDLLLGNARLNAMDRMTVSVGCGGVVDLGFMNTGPGAEWNTLFNVDPTWPGDEGKLTITGSINQPDIGVFQFIRATVVEFGVGADFNDDGFIDFFDLDAYLTCFEQIECPPGRDSDMNGDGFADFFDLDLFLEAYESGAC